MATAGPNSPASAVDNDAAGDVAWTDPGNAVASDNSYATAELGDGVTSHYLDCTQFGFAIPIDSTIAGITAEVERSSAAAGDGEILDVVVRLLKAGVAVGDNKLDSGIEWPETDAYKVYGGAADLWGTTWTAAEVNAAGFGLRLQCTGSNDPETARVDHVRITITYTPPPGLGRRNMTGIGQ